MKRRTARGPAVLRLLAAIPLLAAGCTGPILANAPVSRPVAPIASARPSEPADPRPVTFPGDDAPHDRLTEWWYYTGHLRDRATGDRYGFEFVVFRAERGDFPVTWASHFAITDEHGNRFLYAQRAAVGSAVDRSAGGSGVRPGRPARRCERRRDDGAAGTDLDHGRRQRHRSPRGRADPGRGARGGEWRRPRAQPPADVDQTAGTPRHGRVHRLRRCRRVVLLLAHAHERDGLSGARWPALRRGRRGLVRPPVGRLHRRGWRRLGLVRREPRRWDGPDPLARARSRRQAGARVRDARRAGRHHRPTCRRTRSP